MRLSLFRFSPLTALLSFSFALLLHIYQSFSLLLRVSLFFPLLLRSPLLLRIIFLSFLCLFLYLSLTLFLSLSLSLFSPLCISLSFSPLLSFSIFFPSYCVYMDVFVLFLYEKKYLNIFLLNTGITFHVLLCIKSVQKGVFHLKEHIFFSMLE